MPIAVHDTHPDRSDVVDLRSDTLTQPTDAMRQAMADAAVGDDLFGEDPTVTHLQDSAAKRLGMEAALFVPTGSMANLTAILAHTGGRAEVIAEARSHIFHYEGGSMATMAGCAMRPVTGNRGVFDADTLHAAIRPPGFVFPRQGLVVIENTHNEWGGNVWTADQVRSVAYAADARDLPVHCDGARLFNSAIAQDVAPDRLVADVDSAMFCFSKGLSAPVGSVLCGSAELIEDAIPVRKQLGGAMRQSGVIAAAAQVALDTMVDRLGEDHGRARMLAEGLAALGYGLDVAHVRTNIVVFDATSAGWGDARTCTDELATIGVHGLAVSGTQVRFVTHRHITDDKVKLALERIEAAAPGAKPGS